MRCALLLCGLSACADVSAQRRPAPRPTPTPATNSAQRGAPAAETDNADLAITAHVTARELRFDIVPNPTVEFPGRPARVTAWEAERENLPRPVQPGVTYRDIGIRLVITSVFADIDRIVAEALGEVPVSDDAAPPAADTSTSPAPGAPPAAAALQPTSPPVANTAPPLRPRRVRRP